MHIFILIFPLLSAFFSGVFGRFLGQRFTTRMSTFIIFITFCVSLLFFIKSVFFGETSVFFLFPWIITGTFYVNWGFLFDSLTLLILIVVTSVSTLVHLYSSEYIRYDPHVNRFISYLSLFTFFIIVLVTADNYVQIFVGWEGVGLCSYLLINFWFTRIQANKAAIKAILVNRVGDFGLAIGIIFLYLEYGSTDYSIIFALAPFSSSTTITFLSITVSVLDLVTFLLFVGAVGKSAQLGLHTWLPDAMEGPTPVSALIHAATIVTAGVFLVARSSPIFEYSQFTLWVVTVFGACTAFFAATTGLVQNDLKKVIAYSTCSQLGYMIFACGISAYQVGVFHLANHAFFKALLFLTAGSIIHSINDEQDMRKIGGLVQLIPFTYAIIIIGSLALIGFPFLTGFYSKDLILELAFAKYSISSHFAFWLGSLSAFFTAFYSIRLLFLTFLAPPRGYKKIYEQVHEASWEITFPLFVLSLGSIFFGFFFKDLIVGVGSLFFSNVLFTHPVNYKLVDAEFIPIFFKIIPTFFSFAGISFSFIFYLFFNKLLVASKLNYFGQQFYVFLNKKWFFDKIYNEWINQTFINYSYNLAYKNLDKGVFELFGPYGISFSIYQISSKVICLQTGQYYHYLLVIFTMFFSFTVFLFLVFNLYLFDVKFLFLVFSFWFFILFFEAYSSEVEQSPFKSLVKGSIPFTPKNFNLY